MSLEKKNGDPAMLADAERLCKFRKNGGQRFELQIMKKNRLLNCESAGGRVTEIDVEIHQVAILFKREKVWNV